MSDDRRCGYCFILIHIVMSRPFVFLSCLNWLFELFSFWDIFTTTLSFCFSFMPRNILCQWLIMIITTSLIYTYCSIPFHSEITCVTVNDPAMWHYPCLSTGQRFQPSINPFLWLIRHGKLTVDMTTWTIELLRKHRADCGWTATAGGMIFHASILIRVVWHGLVKWCI